uniref:Uncharacterized protein n=2 Tax=Timema TaxID=61471 RepID=A0A7R9PSG0_TIMGE|nr:unnamed protein product [Timema genevievae]
MHQPCYQRPVIMLVVNGTEALDCSDQLAAATNVNSEIIQTRPSYRRLIPMGDGLEVSDPSPSDDRMETTTSPDRTFKIVFAGDAAVGKSCFIYRFCRGVFINNLGSTLGVDFQVKTIGVDGKKVALQLWDTAGQERFRSMTKTYFRRADGVVLLYDVTNERSFLNVRQWIENIKEATDQVIPIVLCGNKVDQRSEARLQGLACVDMVAGERLSQDHGTMIFFETSSKTGLNIVDTIVTLARAMLTREDTEVQSSSLRIENNGMKGTSCCSASK